MGEKNVPLNMDGVTVHKCKDGVPQAGIPVSGAITASVPVQQGTRAQYAPKAYTPKAEDPDRQRIIVWQNMMGHAVEAIKMTGNFTDMDDSMAKRILFVTDLLFEGTMTKWRTGKLVEIPKDIQDKINQIT
jgi:hypothetical protein